MAKRIKQTIRNAEPHELLAGLQQSLPGAGRAALAALLGICTDRQASLYLVGGAVRDLLLGRAHLDLDLAIEGEVAPIARDLAGRLDARVVTHERFDTATVKGKDFQLDLARTRNETYARPGALPDVRPAGIEADLSRRDFTVNAIALRLTEPVELLDPHGGVNDLHARRIRVLHERSFEDDATRTLRAVRYSTRLDMPIEATTASWLKRDLPFLDAISGSRLRRELTLILEEHEAVTSVREATVLGILPAIHPALAVSPRLARRWTAGSWWRQERLPPIGFTLIAAEHLARAVGNDIEKGTDTADEVVDSLHKRLHLTAGALKRMQDFVRLLPEADKLTATSRSEVTRLLDGFEPASVWALSLVREDVEAICRDYLTGMVHIRPELTGDDLVALGFKRGPELGDALWRLRAARLDGKISGRAQELELARSLLQSNGD